MSTDWSEWHRQYADPTSSLSRRLTTVRTELARVLAERDGTPTQLVSLCAGDGRDALPVLDDGHREVRAVLVELDPALAQTARDEASARQLHHVVVRTADAGCTAALEGVPRADVLLLCGVFGNISDDDIRGTVAALPHLLASGARVIWTRGRRADDDPTSHDDDPAEMVRHVFRDAGFVEEKFIRPRDAGFRVGVHRFMGEPRPPLPDHHLFTFIR